jgi:hypothetical protein
LEWLTKLKSAKILKSEVWQLITGLMFTLDLDVGSSRVHLAFSTLADTIPDAKFRHQ